MHRILACVSVWLVVSCAGGENSRGMADAVLPESSELPLRWRSCAAWDFERQVLQLAQVLWSEVARGELSEALTAEGQDSIRAAVLLGRGSGPSARILLEHLEARRPEPLRHGDAAEVVAAAVLAAHGDRSMAGPLAVLATGPGPHPDLEVRVECGAAALELGRDQVVPFLLRVLHAGTPAELQDPIDWEPTETLAWAKSRAAEALSRRAGVPCAFQPDGSYAHQAEEADRLERLIQGRPRSAFDSP